MRYLSIYTHRGDWKVTAHVSKSKHNNKLHWTFWHFPNTALTSPEICLLENKLFYTWAKIKTGRQVSAAQENNNFFHFSTHLTYFSPNLLSSATMSRTQYAGWFFVMLLGLCTCIRDTKNLHSRSLIFQLKCFTLSMLLLQIKLDTFEAWKWQKNVFNKM